MAKTKRYSDLIKLETFDERFNYLKMNGVIGMKTFGDDRYLNQLFYRSYKWKKIRDQVIIRDNGCDLGILDCPINGKIFVHHLNPISVYDLENDSYILYDLENLITVSYDTHNAIHYGNKNLLSGVPNERKKNDTCPWKE